MHYERIIRKEKKRTVTERKRWQLQLYECIPTPEKNAKLLGHSKQDNCHNKHHKDLA
jgi:hypothetical protein